MKEKRKVEKGNGKSKEHTHNNNKEDGGKSNARTVFLWFCFAKEKGRKGGAGGPCTGLFFLLFPHFPFLFPLSIKASMSFFLRVFLFFLLPFTFVLRFVAAVKSTVVGD